MNFATIGLLVEMKRRSGVANLGGEDPNQMERLKSIYRALWSEKITSLKRFMPQDSTAVKMETEAKQ